MSRVCSEMNGKPARIPLQGQKKLTMLTEEEIKEFQEITLRLYKRKLTREEAEDQLKRMVMAFELILKDTNGLIAKGNNKE